MVGRSCGLAEAENTEKSRVIEAVKMVDFISSCGITEKKEIYTRLFFTEYEPQVLHLPDLATNTLSL